MKKTVSTNIRFNLKNEADRKAWEFLQSMEESAYNRLLAIMTNAGELDEPVAFGDVVDNSYAQKVVNQLK